mgnify:CR=1 FL=1
MSYRVLPLLVVYVFYLNFIVYVLVTNVPPDWFLPVNAFPLMDTLPFYIRGNRSYWELELWEISVCIDYIYSGLYLSYFGKCIQLCLFVFLINAMLTDFIIFLCFSLKKSKWQLRNLLLFLTIPLIIICNIYQLEIYYRSSVF